MSALWDWGCSLQAWQHASACTRHIASRHVIFPPLSSPYPSFHLFFSLFSFSCSFHLILALHAGAPCCFFLFCSDASNAPPLFLPSSNFLPVFLMLHSPGCAIFYSLSPLPAVVFLILLSFPFCFVCPAIPPLFSCAVARHTPGLLACVSPPVLAQ